MLFALLTYTSIYLINPLILLRYIISSLYKFELQDQSKQTIQERNFYNIVKTLGIQQYIDPKSPLYRKYPEELERSKVANFEYYQRLRNTSIPLIVNDLTNKGYKYYNLALREYTQTYNKQLKVLDQIIKFKEIIYQILSLYIYKLNYIEDKAVYIQYANLKRQYKRNKYTKKNAICECYKQAVIPLTYTLKDPIKQLQKQNKAFKEARRYSIIQVEKAKDQQKDLEKALSIFSIRIQVANYYYKYREEIEYNEL